MKKFTRTIHFLEVVAISVNVADMSMNSETVTLPEVDSHNLKAIRKAVENMGYACDAVKVIREYDKLFECTIEEFLSVAHESEK